MNLIGGPGEVIKNIPVGSGVRLLSSYCTMPGTSSTKTQVMSSAGWTGGHRPPSPALQTTTRLSEGVGGDPWNNCYGWQDRRGRQEGQKGQEGRLSGTVCRCWSLCSLWRVLSPLKLYEGTPLISFSGCTGVQLQYLAQAVRASDRA